MINQIIDAAYEAGDAIMEFYEREGDIKVEKKSDHSPLTKADLAAHHIIVQALKELDPDAPVISEESEVPYYKDREDWDEFWLVDPLDGTKEFVKKNGEFTVNIAKIKDGIPVLGVVYAPAKNVMYYAEESIGSFKREGKDASTDERIYSENADTSKPLIVAESRSHKSDALQRYLREKKIHVKSRISSGSSLKFCLVAEGEADIYPRLGPTMEWDVAAGDAVYRYSAKKGVHESGITYNKPDLRNDQFVIGM